MATNVILPALGMAQDTGKIVRWLKIEGESVVKGEPVAEIETDKATVELEAPASGQLVNVLARDGDEVPVGHVIATILAAGELPREKNAAELQPAGLNGNPSEDRNDGPRVATDAPVRSSGIVASPLAARIAAEHNLDLTRVKPVGRRIQKADVLSHIQEQQKGSLVEPQARLLPASPKARRLANEQSKDLASIQGTGPGGAVLTADVLAASAQQTEIAENVVEQQVSAVSNIWRIMAERTTQSWTTVPHFYLVREAHASRLMAWCELIQKRSSAKVTYTDLLVKIVAVALREHPRLNASWQQGGIIQHSEIHIGLAVATPDGLVVPVIHQADTLSMQEIAQARSDLAAKAQAGKLHLQDIADGTFTISNLGMYGVDAFNAVINSPQAAILAVGRIAERVVPVHGQPAVLPMMTLTLTCDHRAVDGARGAQFLDTVATLIEEPLGLLG